MILPNDKWKEIRPFVYQRTEYTPEQIEVLNKRPTKLINEALGASTVSRPNCHTPAK